MVETQDWFSDVLEFLKNSAVTGRTISSTPNPDFPDLEIGMRLIKEEYEELTDAVFRGDLPETADAITDLIYVLLGAAISWGLDIREVWKEVQRTNMAKFGPDGKPLKIANGKVVKPDGWLPPDISAALNRGYIEGGTEQCMKSGS